jgi:NAD(P)H-dependent FMN reductase
MYILAISGSLRAGASNTVLLQAAAILAPPGVNIELYPGLVSLPHFNPDLDTPYGALLPAAVAALRDQVGHADGMLISCPEYAHGIPGSFKNLLDWLVGSVEFPGKPVALLNTSHLSMHAPAQLTEILTTMNARLITNASVTITVGRQRDAAAVAADAELATRLSGAIAEFVRAIEP